MRCAIGEDLKCIRCGRKVSASHVIANCANVERRSPSLQPCLAGSALKEILQALGFSQVGGCQCEQRANVMDYNGCDWCELNIERIVSWLRDEAARRGLPFLDVAGRMLVKRAIKNARKAAALQASIPPSVG